MKTGKPPFAPLVLLLDDDPAVLDLLERALCLEPLEVVAVSEGHKALSILRERDVDLMITDLEMPGMSGLEVLGHLRREGLDPDVIVVTGHATLEAAVACMRLSTVDFLKKPFDPEDVQTRVRSVLDRRLLRREHRAFFSRKGGASPLLIGSSPAMSGLRALLRRVAGSEETALLLGESGTGKELVARSLHGLSPRAAEPFLAVDCTTLSPTVVESELFGHSKGSFTGAEAARMGLFQAAGKGTLFLDEVGDFPLEMQPKLLRALQEREVRPVGSNQAVRFEARILAATHRDLQKLVKDGRFREDLFWRLNVLPIRIPPLRERRDDVPDLVRHFVRRFDHSPEGPREIDASATESLKDYDWPGNVRELENCVRRLLVLHPDVLKIKDLVPPALTGPSPGPAVSSGEPGPGQASLVDWEKTAVRSAIAAARGNMTQAARILEISKSTLYRKLKEFGIDA